MNEEELFCKLFPEYAVNGKPLSPYFDLFESGYEQAEKRIEELEKENAETKERIKTLEYRCENIKDTDTMELVALQRENAELKTDYEVLSCSVGDFGELQDKLEEEQRKNNGLSDNLTKAKEIIKNLLSAYTTYADSFDDRDNEIVEEAEQFLKEVEK